MYYGLELPIEAPKVAIWDMLPMILYISLLKDRYDKAQEKMDKFAEKWGDFTTLLLNDNAYVYNNTVGAIANRLNEMLTSGIDPYRSAEGRGMIEALIRSANTQLLKNIKASAPIYLEFMKNKAKMEAEGRYDEELVKMQLDLFLPLNLKGKVRPEDWDTATMGVFPLSSPIERKTLHELTSDLYKQYAPLQKLRAGDATPEDRARLGKYAKFYDIVGVAPEGRKNALDASVTQLDNTIYGRYFQEQARRLAKVMQQNGINITPEQRYALMIEEANDSHLLPKDVKNDIALRVWEEGQLNWRAQLAHSGDKSDNNKDNQKPTYSALLNSSESNIGRIAGNAQPKVVTVIKNGKKVATVQNAFAQALSKILTNVIKNGGSHKQMINKLSGTYDGGNFAKYMGRKAADEDNNTVYMQSHDVKDLYTANLLINNAWGIKKKSVDTKTQDYLTKVLAPAVISTKGETELNAVRMHATGRITTVMDQQGRVHTYREVYVPAVKKNMYYDLHYEYYSNDEGGLSFDENASVGAMQSDYRSGSDYGLSANANKQLPD